MKRLIIIPGPIEEMLKKHLFQNELEQGAFLYAKTEQSDKQLSLQVIDFYMVPQDGWKIQHELYLEMKDTERAKIMHQARQQEYAVIDCHSHPKANGTVAFSPSDIHGITDFAAYAKWKLGGKPYGAIVWGESSLDAVIWDDFQQAQPVDRVYISGKSWRGLKPRDSWFNTKQKSWWWVLTHGK